jgi:hypothetical protein
LKRLKNLDKDYEQEIVVNYEEEYKKVEAFKKIMIKMIEDYSN